MSSDKTFEPTQDNSAVAARQPTKPRHASSAYFVHKAGSAQGATMANAAYGHARTWKMPEDTGMNNVPITHITRQVLCWHPDVEMHMPMIAWIVQTELGKHYNVHD